MIIFDVYTKISNIILFTHKDFIYWENILCKKCWKITLKKATWTFAKLSPPPLWTNVNISETPPSPSPCSRSLWMTPKMNILSTFGWLVLKLCCYIVAVFFQCKYNFKHKSRYIGPKQVEWRQHFVGIIIPMFHCFAADNQNDSSLLL